MNLRPHLALFGALLFGSVPVAQALDALHQSSFVDLAAQPLSKSVLDLGWQTNVDIICDPQDCKGVSAPRVLGTQTVRSALDTLLRGSGLHYEILDRRSIGIFSSTYQSAAIKRPIRSRNIASVPAVNSVDTAGLLEEVLITGTHIRAADHFPPTTTYSRRDIEESGAGSLEKFISRLPQKLGSNSKATYAVNPVQNGERGASFDLLGLAEHGTLVLIDGHRAAESTIGNFVDVSLIPLAAIDGVEVHSQRAEAIYDADTFVPVVNIVLRKDLTGIASSIRDTLPGSFEPGLLLNGE
jgi:hypothetical protein